jgi:hypothetical protein
MPKGIYPRAPKISVVCSNCGAAFMRTIGQMRGQNTVFCSLACRAVYNADGLRFERSYIPEPNSGCWLWTGAVGAGGYGVIFFKGRHTLAHRAAYELFVQPPPRGLFICHRCDNRACVNPEHLFVGTASDNSADMVGKNRQAKGEQRANSKINPALVRAILGSSLPDTEWATRLNVTKGTINHIRHRRNWRHVEV